MLHEENTRYSKYEPKMKQTLTYVQVVRTTEQSPWDYSEVYIFRRI